MSFPRYPSYKDSGVEWLGAVPEHWDYKSIKRCTYLKGRVGWKGLTSEEYLDEGYAYLVTGTDFSAKFISWSDCHCVDEGRYADDPFIQLVNGDLLITKDGTIGKLALVSGLDRPACLNSGIFLLRPQDSYTTAFMYWVLSSNPFRVFCDLASLGSTIQHLYQNVFERFIFPVPTSAEQTQVAAFLDRETAKIDELVAEQRRLMELLKEKRQAVISHAVTQGLNPDAPMKPSDIEWLGDVPAHWEVMSLRRCASSVQTGGTPSTEPPSTDLVEGLVWFTPGDFSDSLFLTNSTRKIASEVVASGEAKVFPPRSVLIVSIGATLGKVGFAEQASSANQQINAVIPNERVDGYFLAYSLLVKAEVMRFLSNASTIGIMNQEKTKDIWLAVPPTVEQIDIAGFLDTETAKLDTLTAEAQRAIDLLQERRTALISAAVTGQIDVRALTEREVA